MTQRRTFAAAAVALTALAGGQLAAWSTAQAAAEPRNPGIVRLQADATDGLRIERNAAGVADFVGADAGSEVVNPAVSAATTVRAAAQSHLTRYGAALGLANDAELSITRSERSASGQDVVRFQQEVDSAPVIGGQVVVSLRADRQLSSLLSTVSTLRSLPAATVSEAAARTTAASAAARAAGGGDLTTTNEGRAVWDPAIFNASRPGSAQGVWKFEVGDGVGVRRLVLVDDTSGRVLVNLDQIEHIDRVVCDRANARGARDALHDAASRASRAGRPAASREVNAAFDNAGSGLDGLQPRSPASTSPTSSASTPPAGRSSPRRCATAPDVGQHLPLRQRVLERHPDVLRRHLRRCRRRGRARDDPRRRGPVLRALLLGPERRDQRVDGRHHGRDRRPPRRAWTRGDATGCSARTCRSARSAT